LGKRAIAATPSLRSAQLAATSRKLVGANRVNDTPTYCNNTSASISSGNVPVPYPHYCVGSGAGTQRSQTCGNP
jgi:hypothetical protein